MDNGVCQSEILYCTFRLILGERENYLLRGLSICIILYVGAYQMIVNLFDAVYTKIGKPGEADYALPNPAVIKMIHGIIPHRFFIRA